MAQWWERSPPTNVARVRLPVPVSYVGCVCCWFSSLLREVFLRVLRFSPLLKNQHIQIPIRSWRCPQLAFFARYRWHLNKVIYLFYFMAPFPGSLRAVPWKVLHLRPCKTGVRLSPSGRCRPCAFVTSPSLVCVSRQRPRLQGRLGLRLKDLGTRGGLNWHREESRPRCCAKLKCVELAVQMVRSCLL